LKAIRITEIGRPLEEQQTPTPVPQAGEVLVRVMAAGICHSDAHYRAGVSPVGPLPITPGHEVAGVVEALGPGTVRTRIGDRVALHYLVTCGQCSGCNRGQEQFCETGQMIGKHRDGGYAEYICVPERGIVPLPEEVPFEWAAIMMCSSATSFHALRKARVQPGETVAVFGAGGLGMSAIQLAKGLGARDVYAVDINRDKLVMAASFGAIPVDASQADPVELIRHLTNGRGVDVSLELIGLPLTMRQAVQVLANQGRAALAGITRKPFEVDSYFEVVGREAEIIGVSDHLLQEFPLLMDFAKRRVLNLSHVVTNTVPLAAGPINETLDALERWGGEVRTVIVP
jgi:D-arabinose 1-dehydrogenase-like Zn-dependent alcohol dehydrogenase